MNNYQKLLVLGLTIALFLPLIGLSGCVNQQTTTPKISSLTATAAVLQLAFAGNRNGKYALFVINIDGSGETQITSSPDDDYTHPSWSPYGTMLAAQRLHSWPWIGEKWSIETINLNNGTLHDLTGEEPVILSVLSPVFSPYGNLIICDGTGSFTTVNLGGVKGSIITTISGNPVNPGNPDISPDATKIAFDFPIMQPSPTPTSTTTTSGGDGLTSAPGISQTTPPPTVTRIAVVDFEGTNFKQLTTSEGTYNDRYPSWSPDGKKIAFMSDRTGKNQIYVMNADGTGQTQITNDSFDNHDPAWSPDGAYIAYVSDHSGISELCIIRPDGTGRIRINRVAEMVQTPAWRSLQGKVFNGLTPPTISSSVPTASPAQTTVSNTGQLFISTSGAGENYSIYVNGALVGQNWTNLTLAPGSYRVTIYNRNGTKVYDKMSTVIAGKTSQVKLSGLN